jgi:2-oxoglutarate dehydrogenase E2 component (dihydrolipoamide succinyltransferase)
MPVSVTMPRLGESVTEGTVTRWLKKAGERVEADEPLLEVSTDKVDTEIPSPAAGVLAAIRVGEDETVEVGVELATIEESGTDASAKAEPAAAQPPAEAEPAQQPEPQPERPAETQPAQQPEPQPERPAETQPAQQPERPAETQPAQQPSPSTERAEPAAQPAQQPQPSTGQAEPDAQPAEPAAAAAPAPAQAGTPTAQPVQPVSTRPALAAAADPPAESEDDMAGAYVTPLVRKLAADHGVDLSLVKGSGVGGRIRKQDVLEAARALQPAETVSAPAAEMVGAEVVGAPAVEAGTGAGPMAHTTAQAPAAAGLRGRTEKMSRLRNVIAQRMVESLQVSAQLTTVVEVDVTRIARLRAQHKADFEAREGVRLSFLPFFALAAVEALKQHPKLNASIDPDAGSVTYHDAEHLVVAVDTERGLLVPVIHNAGDLNLAGLARKIADLAARTRGNRISPDELSGGTFTLTNTGSRGALFDTPIINQPQVAILGTGAVVKRPVVVDDPDLGEVISVRSMVYLALTYDHRLVDGADAARFLTTIKERLETGQFEAELGHR